MDIRVLDHIIVGGVRYSSMAEDGYLPCSISDKANYEPIPIDEKDQVEEITMTYENDFEEDEELEM